MSKQIAPSEGSAGSTLSRDDSAPRAGLSSLPTPYYDKGGQAIYHGDALEILPDLPPVDLIAVDPPYYKVKGEWWDRQWDKPAQFLEWIGRLCDEWQRVLKPNGSLYVFASPQMAWGVEGEVRKRFDVLNEIRWVKPFDNSDRRHTAQILEKELARSYYPSGERVIFAEHFNADNHAKGEAGYGAKCDELRGFVFEPLRAYLDGERKAAGVDKADCNAACGFSRTPGGMASRHYFSRSQWCLPTVEHYGAMQQLFNASTNGNGPQYLRREYEDLRREYEDLRREYEYLRREYEYLRREYEDLRRPFNATPDRPYTDVWTFPTVQDYPGKHPCEKPLAMMEHIIETSTREGATVLDCCMGSGNTLRAARNYGRQGIGIDIEKKWCRRAKQQLIQKMLAFGDG